MFCDPKVTYLDPLAMRKKTFSRVILKEKKVSLIKIEKTKG